MKWDIHGTALDTKYIIYNIKCEWYKYQLINNIDNVKTMNLNYQLCDICPYHTFTFSVLVQLLFKKDTLTNYTPNKYNNTLIYFYVSWLTL